MAACDCPWDESRQWTVHRCDAMMRDLHEDKAWATRKDGSSLLIEYCHITGEAGGTVFGPHQCNDVCSCLTQRQRPPDRHLREYILFSTVRSDSPGWYFSLLSSPRDDMQACWITDTNSITLLSRPQRHYQHITDRTGPYYSLPPSVAEPKEPSLPPDPDPPA